MYKIIAIDMDGTLLNSQRVITPATKQAIQLAREKGIKVVLASGRPIAGIRDKLNELNITTDQDYVLHFNGSIVENVGTGAIIHSQILTGKDAKRIAKIATNLDVNTHAFSRVYGLITPKISHYTRVEAEINGISITEMNFEQLEDDHPIIKAMIVDEPARLSVAIENMPADLYHDYTVVKSSPYFLEFLNTQSNKGLGIKTITEHLGLKPENVMCIGDAENDHHMLNYAGLGVAMANAMDETKQLADYITFSNDEDGVAHAIHKFALV